jgi:hypothetical protein
VAPPIPTPLLDFFKQGEVDRDVRMQAAQGVLAPRAHEQLAILVLLLEDKDREVRETADETLNKIPEKVLKTFLARSDAPIDLREIFGDRGIFPDEMPPLEVDYDEPLIDTDSSSESGEQDGDDRESGVQALAAMNFPQRLKAAMKGTREQRAILIRDANKLISTSVLSSPKVSGAEVESFARMQNVSEDVLRRHPCPGEKPEDPAGDVAQFHGPADHERCREAGSGPKRAGGAAHRGAKEDGRQFIRKGVTEI